MQRALLAWGVALAIGLALGLVAFSGGDAGAADALRPADVKLERMGTPSVGAISVPALKVTGKATTTRPVTPPPPPVVAPPVLPPPPPVVAPPPPPVVAPPPPPSIIVVPG